MILKYICKELKEAIAQKPFFEVSGGCGIDMSNGESQCMADDGIWFKYCPFCGGKIIKKDADNGWNWWEEKELTD